MMKERLSQEEPAEGLETSLQTTTTQDGGLTLGLEQCQRYCHRLGNVYCDYLTITRQKREEDSDEKI